MNVIEITSDELISEPEERKLLTNKSITSFNIKMSQRTINLNTGNKFDYNGIHFEIMNREHVHSVPDYIKFNCTRKIKFSLPDE